MKSFLVSVSCLFLLSLQAQPLNLDWVNTLGGNYQDGVKAVKSDNDGNLFVTGWFMGTVDFDPGPWVYSLTGIGQSNIFTCKYDASGELIWAKAQAGNDTGRSMDITLDDSGNVYTTGFFRGTVDFDPGMGVLNMTAAGSLWESYISKLDPQGNLLWAKKFGSSDSWGAASLKTDQAGNVIATGIFQGTCDFDPGPGVFNMNVQAMENAFILKLNTNGDFVWAKQIKVTTAYGQGVAVDVDPSGNIYAVGGFSSTADLDPGPGTQNVTSNGEMDTYILKLDPAGNIAWAKHFGSSNTEYPATVDVSSTGNIYVTGLYDGGGVDFDPGSGTCFLPFNGWVDFYIMKLDNDGNFAWCKGIGGDEYDRVNSVVIDSQEKLYVAGSFRVDVDFNPGPGTFQMSTIGSGADDGFVMSLDSDGDFGWAGKLSGNMNYCLGLDFNPQYGLYVVGTYANPTDFDPSAGTYVTYPPSGYPDGYLMRLTYGSHAGLETLSDNSGITAFPNPFNSELTVAFDESPGQGTLNLINSLGETVLERKTFSGKSITLATDELPAGVYFLSLQNGEKISRIKVVK